jgi:hypothetical protein
MSNVRHGPACAEASTTIARRNWTKVGTVLDLHDVPHR